MAVSATRDRAAERRARTRHLIELGGLVVKSGLVDLAADDRATLLGLLLRDAERLHDGDDEGRPTELRARARRRGLQAFDEDAADTGTGDRKEVERLPARAG